nr:hypothetical protein CFP56_04076 [Quercus suber]
MTQPKSPALRRDRRGRKDKKDVNGDLSILEPGFACHGVVAQWTQTRTWRIMSCASTATLGRERQLKGAPTQGWRVSGRGDVVGGCG